MLNLLRKIDWPNNVNIVGGLVRGDLVNQVSDYYSLMKKANDNAVKIELDLREKLAREVEETRIKIAESVKKDFLSLKNTLIDHKNKLESKSIGICTQISKLAISNFVNDLDDELKIKSMIEILLPKLNSTSEIIFSVHPDLHLTLETVLEKSFGSIVNADEYKIVDDRTLDKDLVRVKSYKDAFIEISIKNIVAILTEEVDYLNSSITASMTVSSAGMNMPVEPHGEMREYNEETK